MAITKADIVQKSDRIITSVALAQKVTASDVNELKRVTDDIVDTMSSVKALYICEGVLTQSIGSQQKILVDQWTSGVNVANASQSLSVEEPGLYLVMFYVSYETNSRNGEVFKIRGVDNEGIIPGVCDRSQHQHPATTVYKAIAFRPVLYSEPRTISIEIEALTLSETRTVAIRHGAFALTKLA